MRILQQLVTAVGYSLEMPPGWTVIAETGTGLLRAVLRASVKHREDASSIQVGDADFLIRLVEVSPGTDLEAYAEARMKREVWGEADRFADTIDGRRALGYGFTNGVQEIATWFVEPVPGTAVRVDHAISLRPDREEGVNPREDGMKLLSTMRWVVSTQS